MLYVFLISTTVFVLLLGLERMHPLRSAQHNPWERLKVNALITALAFAVNGLVVQPAAQGTIAWSGHRDFGLLHWVNLSPLGQAIVGFLLLDLSFYYWHRLNHRLLVLWRFHNVHHIDPDLDVSTGFRFHFGEILFSAGFRVLQVSLIGVSLPVYLIYETVFQANTLFHHSNVQLPRPLERWLNWLLVTPRMHGIHHSQVQAETNSNYSVVFSFWDRLHRTLRFNVDAANPAIGVPAYSQGADNRVLALIKLPFQSQRDYWGEESSSDRLEPALD